MQENKQANHRKKKEHHSKKGPQANATCKIIDIK
jgi:hypothetical protein